MACSAVGNECEIEHGRGLELEGLLMSVRCHFTAWTVADATRAEQGTNVTARPAHNASRPCICVYRRRC